MRYAIGTFTVTSDSIRITDPGFTSDRWCAGQIPAVPGTWTAHVVIRQSPRHGRRVRRLLAHHRSFILNPDETVRVENKVRLVWQAGVDYGSCGIFDANMYRTQGNGQGTEKDPTTFCGQASALIRKQNRAGVFPWGCVSKAGHGNGFYWIYVVRDATARAVYVEVVFIDDETEEDVAQTRTKERGASLHAS
ncbi:MAG: hypothetical protein AAB384_04115 [Patescibacteria group bacterium]